MWNGKFNGKLREMKASFAMLMESVDEEDKQPQKNLSGKKKAKITLTTIKNKTLECLYIEIGEKIYVDIRK